MNDADVMTRDQSNPIRCLTCRFWNYKSERKEQTYAERACQKRSPEPTADAYPDYGKGKWPKTQADDWCGDYEMDAARVSALDSEWARRIEFGNMLRSAMYGATPNRLDTSP